jgi:hypothetical protein
MDLGEFLGKEVFVFGPDSILGETGEVHVFDSMTGLIAYLLSIDASTDPEAAKDMRILHGYLTSADVLPSTFGNRNVFLILEEPYDDATGLIVESAADDPEGLAYEIEQLIDHPNIGLSNSVHSGPDLTGIEIENVFVLYGYEISARFAIDLDDINENFIRECKMIAAEVNLIKRRNKEMLD